MLARTKKVIATIAVMGSLIIVSRTQALANLVTNGGFEDTGDYIQKHTDIPVDPDTAAMWDLDEGTGTTATDDSTYSNNGTLTANATTGTADGGSTTTLVDDALTQTDDTWNTWMLKIVTAGGAAPEGESCTIDDFDFATHTITTDPANPFSAAIEAGDTYKLYYGDENGPTWNIGGKTGNALDFDGTDDYVNCGSGDSLNITSAITVEAWVKLNGHQDNYDRIVDKLYSSAWGVGIRSDKLWIRGKFGGVLDAGGTSTETVSVDEWNHVVWTYDGTIIRFFINGAGSGSRTPGTGGNIGTNLNAMAIGSYYSGGSSFINGTIDEVRISDVARICPESWDVSDNLTTNLYNGCLYQTSAVTHDGTYSLKMMPTAGAAVEFSTQVTPDITVQNKGKYKLSGWIRTDGTYNGSFEPRIVAISGTSTTTLTGGGDETHDTWKHYYGYITADDTACTITLKCYGSAGSCWFDDIELIPAPTGTMIRIGQLPSP